MTGCLDATDVGPISVLHVDDEQDQLRFCSLFLPKHDPSLHVHSTDSPLKALDLIQGGGYDCVVTDYRMDEMSGIDLVVAIREMSDIPIILYTGHGSEQVAETAFNVGVDDYIRKEVDPSHYHVLARRVRHHVERHWVESLYRSVAEDARDALSILVGSTRVYANQALAELYGVEDKSCLIGESALDRVNPGDRAAGEDRIVRRKRGDEISGSYTTKIIRRDGEVRVVETSSSRVMYRGKAASLHFTRDITEQVEMESRIRESEQRYRNMFELFPLSIVTADMKGFITYVNDTFTKYTGYGKERVVGRHFSELDTIYPQDMSQYTELFASPVIGETPRSALLRYRHKNGSERWAQIYISFIEAEGESQGIQTIFVDVTDKLAAEEMLRGFMDSATDGFALLDENLDFIDVNPLYVRRSGLDKEDIIGSNLTEIVPHLKDSPRLQQYRRVVEDGTPFTVEDVRMSQRHGYRRLKVRAFKVGKGLGVITSDVTYERNYLDRLVAMHEHALKLGEAETVQEVYNYTLDAMERVLGFDRSSIIMVEGDKLVQKLTRGDFPNGIEMPVHGKGLTARAAKEKKSILVNDVRESEDYISVSNLMGERTLEGYSESRSELVSPIISDGEAIGVLNVESTSLNTYKKEDMQLLEILASHLSSSLRRIESKTMLENLSRRHVDEVLEGADRVASTFRHDLRNPLSTIKNAVYILEREPDALEEMLPIIKGNVVNMSEVLSELSFLAKPDQLAKTSVDLVRLIDEVVDATFLPDNVMLDEGYGGGAVEAELDRVKFRRVLVNLIKNSVEAMPDGGVLGVSMDKVDGDAVIKIWDTGVGIPEEFMVHLFQPFATTKPTGTGLGLVSSKQIVEAHGGSISVESKQGEGTAVTVSIPL
ncbi:PAS domain S-box protein [Candidatus Bathyarchaeota archaeon]|nr:PAS domain S-box protein [Candidatus Bathyarchaeota archaeon]